ncbi:MAG TPA: protein YgfX [Rhodanobacteraceae bacterium]|jgi:toxin CptA|nr:protein YgfX [Rhodanobacteraceae bacterium]
MKAAPAIGFGYRTSRRLILVTSAVATLALVAVWLSGLPRWAHFVLTLGVAGVTGAAFGDLLRPRVRSILWRADGGADLVLNGRGDRRHEARGAIQAVRVMGPLIALTLRWPPRERAHLWLLPDNLDADVRRRLRMRLGTRAGKDGASGNPDSG